MEPPTSAKSSRSGILSGVLEYWSQDRRRRAQLLLDTESEEFIIRGFRAGKAVFETRTYELRTAKNAAINFCKGASGYESNQEET